jgi:3-phenylpropionate/cinnamic acid dioxygenase small subunit
MSEMSPAQAAEFLYREAQLLDERRWDEWVELYAEDAVFWVPAWKSEDEPTSSPDTELSLIYYEGRSNLADRVWRARSNLSVASTPLHRTAHAITNVLLEPPSAPDRALVKSSWATHMFNPRRKTQHVFFGLAEHALRLEGGVWRIARKKVLLLNDYIPAVLDFYMV